MVRLLMRPVISGHLAELNTTHPLQTWFEDLPEIPYRSEEDPIRILLRIWNCFALKVILV